MLTVAEETLLQLAKDHDKQVATHLYGQEIYGETFAICKVDLLLNTKAVIEALDAVGLRGPAFHLTVQ
jgi:type I restriction-modification system DNA methylase subunit